MDFDFTQLSVESLESALAELEALPPDYISEVPGAKYLLEGKVTTDQLKEHNPLETNITVEAAKYWLKNFIALRKEHMDVKSSTNPE